MEKRLLPVLMATLAVITLSSLSLGTVFAASPEDNPGKGLSNFDKVVFVHYPKGIPAKGGIPGPPGGNSDKAEKEWYKYSGIHWANPAAPVFYRVNADGDDDYLYGIQTAFQTWEEDPNSYIDFEYDSTTLSGMPSSFIGAGTMNDANEVGWVSITDNYPNAIAVTVVWYNRFTGFIAEVDMGMNADLPWSQNSLAADTDWNSVSGDANSYDVQNIATHEVGHWLMLGDMYNKPTTEQTMYGYGMKDELKKRSLESGDLAGIMAIYGN